MNFNFIWQHLDYQLMLQNILKGFHSVSKSLKNKNKKKLACVKTNNIFTRKYLLMWNFGTAELKNL